MTVGFVNKVLPQQILLGTFGVGDKLDLISTAAVLEELRNFVLNFLGGQTFIYYESIPCSLNINGVYTIIKTKIEQGQELSVNDLKAVSALCLFVGNIFRQDKIEREFVIKNSMYDVYASKLMTLLN